jgi:hypothetical protein
MPQKTPLTLETIDSQAGFELPARETMLVTIVITNVLNHLTVDIPIKNNNVAVQVCAAVGLLNTILAPASLTCDIQQSQ